MVQAPYYGTSTLLWYRHLTMVQTPYYGTDTLLWYIYLTMVEAAVAPLTQCVAVRTHWGWINEPPQKGDEPGLDLSWACQGQSPWSAEVPPIILADGRIPQDPVLCNKYYWFVTHKLCDFIAYLVDQQGEGWQVSLYNIIAYLVDQQGEGWQVSLWFEGELVLLLVAGEGYLVHKVLIKLCAPQNEITEFIPS